MTDLSRLFYQIPVPDCLSELPLASAPAELYRHICEQGQALVRTHQQGQIVRRRANFRVAALTLVVHDQGLHGLGSYEKVSDFVIGEWGRDIGDKQFDKYLSCVPYLTEEQVIAGKPGIEVLSCATRAPTPKLVRFLLDWVLAPDRRCPLWRMRQAVAVAGRCYAEGLPQEQIEAAVLRELESGRKAAGKPASANQARVLVLRALEMTLKFLVCLADFLKADGQELDVIDMDELLGKVDDVRRRVLTLRKEAPRTEDRREIDRGEDGEPAKPAEPTRPAESAKPAGPTEPAKPAEPAKPEVSAKPAEPEKPEVSAKPAEPTKPAEPAKPAEPGVSPTNQEALPGSDGEVKRPPPSIAVQFKGRLPGKWQLVANAKTSSLALGEGYVPPHRGLFHIDANAPFRRPDGCCQLCGQPSEPTETDPDLLHQPLCPFYEGDGLHYHNEDCKHNGLCPLFVEERPAPVEDKPKKPRARMTDRRALKKLRG